jgi:hypothetical protein
MTKTYAPHITPGLTSKGYRNVAAYKRHIASTMPPGALRDQKEVEARAYDGAAEAMEPSSYAAVEQAHADALTRGDKAMAAKLERRLGEMQEAAHPTPFA